MVLAEAAPSAQAVPNTDSSVFLYVGQRILYGDVPYRDVWDHKGPLIYYIDALGQLLTPEIRWGVWFLELVFVILAAWLLVDLAEHTFGFWPAIFGSVLFLLQLHLVLDGGNLTEEYALPLQFLCFWLFARSLQTQGRLDLLFAGLAAAACFWLRPNLIGVPLALTILLLLRGRLTPFVVGGLMGLAPVVLYFWSQGALPAMWSALFRFNLAYSAQDNNVWRVLWTGYQNLPFLMLFGLAGWVASLALLRGRARLQPTVRSLLLIACLALPFEIGLTLFSGRDFSHYYMSWMPALALLSAGFMFFLNFNLAPSAQRMPRRLHLTKMLVLALLLGYAPGALAIQWPALASMVRMFAGQGFASPDLSQHRYGEVLDYLSQHVEPERPLFVLGNQATLNWLSGRAAPTRFVYQTPLFIQGYPTPAMLAELLASLQANPPVIIDTGPPGGFLPSMGTRMVNLPEVVRPLYHYLQEHYVYAGTFPATKWDLYLFLGQGETLDAPD